MTYPDAPGNAAKIFETLGKYNLNVDMIIQSATRDNGVNDISFTIPKSDLAAARDVLENLRAEVGYGEVVYSGRCGLKIPQSAPGWSPVTRCCGESVHDIVPGKHQYRNDQHLGNQNFLHH